MLRQVTSKYSLINNETSASATAALLSSSTRSNSSRQWGDWNESSSTSSTSSSSGRNTSSSSYHDDAENVSRVNYYDSKAFIGQARGGATVICRKKPIVKSYSALLLDYLRPKKEFANSYIDSQQLAKIVGYLVIPVLTIIFWKGHYEEYPDYWERQAAQIQSRPLNDQEGAKKKYSYFDVIDSLESKREQEMVRKGYGSQQQQSSAPKSA